MIRFCLAAFLLVLGGAASAQDIPRPEHPDPSMYRQEWLSLNGPWEFGETNEDESERFLGGEAYPDTITVPFCRESKASGLGRTEFVKNVWYRRAFTVPSEWVSPRVRLHIGACDWRTQVWVNGQRVGEHVGGNVSFCFDITEQIIRDAENTVVIHAFDDTASGKQALGKQSITGKSQGIFYTPTTGIWQSVWLEGVGASYLHSMRVDPRPESGVFLMSFDITGDTRGLMVEVEAHTPQGKEARGLAHAQRRDTRLLLTLTNPRLWTQENPFLYNLRIRLLKGGQPVDELTSYAGLRSVTLDGNAILLNGKAVFQRLVLDQGFYPDGIWTAPTDEALKQDIELSKAAGFNGARLHQKVFEPRFLYWADRLGYLCWGEFPSYGANYADPAVNAPIIREWTEIVTRDRNHPSIIGWCPFNETPHEARELQDTVLDLTRQLDPSRPCIETSGWVHHVPDPEVLDAHDYEQNPEVFRSKYASDFPWKLGVRLPERYKVQGLPRTPFFLSEYGGIGWSLDENAWGYGNTPENIEAFYARFEGLTSALLQNRHMFGLCYTQLTDIEQEQNGIYYYDRKPKFDLERIRGVLTQQAAYEEEPPVGASLASAAQAVDWKVLVGSANDGAQAGAWRYTTTAPATGWEAASFDASAWSTGRAPFGFIGGDAGDSVQTKWRDDEIWLRQTFTAESAEFDLAVMVLYHDDDTELFLNGEPIWSGKGWTTKYEAYNLSEAVRGKLKPGENTIAVHVKQDKGGQFFDMALVAGKITSSESASAKQ